MHISLGVIASRGNLGFPGTSRGSCTPTFYWKQNPVRSGGSGTCPVVQRQRFHSPLGQTVPLFNHTLGLLFGFFVVVCSFVCFPYLKIFSCVPAWACCLLHCHSACLRRAWFPLVCILPFGSCGAQEDVPEPAVCLELSKHSSCAPADPAIMVVVPWTCSSMTVSFFFFNYGELETGHSTPDVLLQVSESNNPNTWPTGCPFADTARWLVFSSLPSPNTLFLSAKLVPSTQLVLFQGVMPSQVWDLASGKC